MEAHTDFTKAHTGTELLQHHQREYKLESYFCRKVARSSHICWRGLFIQVQQMVLNKLQCVADLRLILDVVDVVGRHQTCQYRDAIQTSFFLHYFHFT